MKPGKQDSFKFIIKESGIKKKVVLVFFQKLISEKTKNVS